MTYDFLGLIWTRPKILAAIHFVGLGLQAGAEPDMGRGGPSPPEIFEKPPVIKNLFIYFYIWLPINSEKIPLHVWKFMLFTCSPPLFFFPPSAPKENFLEVQLHRVHMCHWQRCLKMNLNFKEVQILNRKWWILWKCSLLNFYTQHKLFQGPLLCFYKLNKGTFGNVYWNGGTQYTVEICGYLFLNLTSDIIWWIFDFKPPLKYGWIWEFEGVWGCHYSSLEEHWNSSITI